MKVTVCYSTESTVEVDDKYAEMTKCDLHTQEGYVKWDTMAKELETFLQTKLPANAEIKWVYSDEGDLYEN